ncbi:MAG: M23 family metallopeptidase, partial [Acutalibacteraceae bacterium]
PYGPRKVIKTSAGETSSFHNGVDYATYSVKLPQYAIEDGEVVSVGKDTAYGNALYVWVKYPRLGVKMLHYHLDSYKVKAGQKVTKDTVLGYTGKTGYATGIHLHLGLKLLSGGGYIDPEAWFEKNYKAPTANATTAKYTAGNYKVTKAAVLNVRTGAGTKHAKKTYSQLTADAQKKILKLAGYKANGYVKGLAFTVSKVSGNWGQTPSGWVCLDYCERV